MTQTFADLGVPATLVRNLERDGKTTPFPIQASTLPQTLAGRDVLGRGKTGSGKTLAFSLPVVARIGAKNPGGKPGRTAPGRPKALILAPTRELATQIDAVISPLASDLNLTTTTIFGGVSQHRQEVALRRGVDIVVACPGRLEDLMGQGIVSLDDVQITVLDEADHMADLGFLPGVTRIMNATPKDGQRLLFSATLDNGVDTIVKRFMTDPSTHSVDSAESPVEAMTHHVFHLAGADAKKDVLRALASGTGRRVLFTRTKHHAKRMAKQLTSDGIPAVDLHGNLSQNARDRNLAAFASGDVKVLVATDVAARGVHVDGVELVVHVDPPAEHKAYLHRSGRTARAGSEGDVVTLVLPEQRRDTAQLLRRAKIDVTPQQVTATSDAVVTLVGEVAPHVAPVATSERPQQRRGNGRGRSGARRTNEQSHDGERRNAGRDRNRDSGRGTAQPGARKSSNGHKNDAGTRGEAPRRGAGVSAARQGSGRSGNGRGRGHSNAGRSGGGQRSAADFSAKSGGARRRSR
ncbi:DEAD/DEAH box helicase [Demequina sp. B12]|uniref:DEAD/DEAH box helicase n=1 Tax=Demequina sp. B12 TaxID=2992757 RepID=UPI00237BF117|nr:DEAD/DEAH box helicase [Demequina sp. B12]MDE0573288.1 DEAD/DEAH box helicase [Demequina sp. B12]